VASNPPTLAQPDDQKALGATLGLTTPSSGPALIKHGESFWLSAIEDRWRQCRMRDYWLRRKEWELNRAIYQGHQEAFWLDRHDKLVLDPEPTQESIKRLKIPLYRAFVLGAAARIASTHPIFDIRAGSNDQEAIDDSQVARSFLAHEWHRQHMDVVIANTAIPMCLTGGSWWKVEWDPNAGRSLGEQALGLTDPMTGEPVIGPDGQPVPVIDITTRMPRVQVTKEGQIITRHRHEDTVYPDPMSRAHDLSDAMWLIDAQRHSCASIYDVYGVDVPPEPIKDREFMRDPRAAEWMRNLDSATVIQCWMKPGRRWPTGKVVTMASGMLLEEPKDWPYEHGEYPYVYIPYLPNDEHFHGDTPFSDLRSPQAALNRSFSQAVEADEFMAMPQWLIPMSTAIADQQASNLAGIERMYDDTAATGMKPERIDGKGASGTVFRLIDLMIQAVFPLIAGQNAGGMLGGAPVNVESAPGLNALVERDVSKLALPALCLGAGIKRWAELNLALGKQFIVEERMVPVVGSMLEGEVRAFNRKRIHDTFDVHVRPDSVMPMDEQSKVQETLMLWQSQLIDRETAQERLGTRAGQEPTLMQLEANLARDENAQARETGQITTPLEQMAKENHLVHVREHLKDFFSPRVQRRGLDGMPGPAWFAELAHIQAHEMLMFQQQMASGGGPPGAPPSPDGQPAPAPAAGAEANPGAPTEPTGGGQP
jgi:hypothetical protein